LYELLTELILIRHGESRANAGETRHHDSELTARGWEQVRAAAQELAAITAGGGPWVGLVSPYLRTRQTAEPVAAALGIDFDLDWRLREYCGPDASRAHKPIPGHESWLELPEHPHELAARIREFLADIGERHERVVVVSHGAPLLMIATETQQAGQEYPGWRNQIANASVMRIRTGRGGA
jgi:broad specificity phosphatase PhoE